MLPVGGDVGLTRMSVGVREGLAVLEGTLLGELEGEPLDLVPGETVAVGTPFTLGSLLGDTEL